jgi:hypothetical protein
MKICAGDGGARGHNDGSAFGSAGCLWHLAIITDSNLHELHCKNFIYTFCIIILSFFAQSYLSFDHQNTLIFFLG